MSFMRTRRQASVQTPMPENVSEQDVHAALRDHIRMIKLSPFVFEHRQLEGREAEQALSKINADLSLQNVKVYAARERIPYYGAIEFSMAFRDDPDGSTTYVAAPMGLKMHVKSTVKHEKGLRVYDETCDFDGNGPLMPFTVYNFKKAHRDLQKKLLLQLSGKE